MQQSRAASEVGTLSPAAAATLCGDLPSLCAHPGKVLVPATFLLVAAVGTLGVGTPAFRPAPLLAGSSQTAEFGVPFHFCRSRFFPILPLSLVPG